MNNLIQLYQNFLLVSLRAGCMLYCCPPWDSSYIPGPVRVLSILGLSLALTPIVSPSLPPFPATWSGGIFLVIREFLIGLSCGMVFRFLFAGVEMAGNLVATQMGFGMATLLDPQTQAQNTILAQMLVLLTTVLFLTIDGHHAFLRLVVKSFQEVPLKTDITLPAALSGYVSGLGQLMFNLSVQLLAPVLALLFLIQLALGLLARAVPQIQVMMVSFPLTIALGLLFLSFSLMAAGPFLAERLTNLQIPLAHIIWVWKD
jgi:flagellar biosynthesis protein FliR